LPWDVSKVLMTYLAIVVPFHELINREWESNGYLFTDGKGGHWNTDKQSRIMARESQSRLGFRITTASWRQLQVAFDREFVRTGLPEEDSDSDGDGEDDVHDLRAAHSARVANNHYGRKGLRINTTTVNLFRGVSDKWQAWLAMRARPIRSWFEKHKDSNMEESSMEVKVTTALERVHGIGASWKSKEQEQATFAIIDGQSPLVCILPTGGGKTTLILVPALVNEGKTTVVVTPYIALADSLVDQCKELEITCMRWIRPTVERAMIVVVVSDTGTSQEFTAYVRDLYLRDCLASVYFDEAHTLRTERHFRHKFELFRRLALAVPWIFLTATFPPSMAAGFEESMAMTRPRPRYIRAATNRTLTAYSVIQAKDGDIEECLVNLLDEAGQGLEKDEKIMVFCPSVADVKNITSRIKCCSYHSRDQDKSESLAAWKRGEEKIMVTTSALGAGLNIQGVVHVFHFRKPYGCMQFVQESGRAGRAGEKVKSTLIIEEGEYERLARMDERVFSEDNRALRGFVLTMGCRRLHLSQYLDGDDNEVDCKALDGELCDNCCKKFIGNECQKRQHESELEDTRKRRLVETYARRDLEVQENEQEDAILLDRIQNMMKNLRGKCTICWVRGQYEEAGKHEVKECELFNVLGIGGRVVKFVPDSCCFKCCLPGDLCESYGEHRVCEGPELAKHWVEIKVGEEDTMMLKCIEDVAGRRFSSDRKGIREMWEYVIIRDIK